MSWGAPSESVGASSPDLLAQNWGCDQGPLTTQQQLHQPAMNTNEWQWAGFQLYLEMTDFWGQCRVLHQKPSVGILDLSSPLQYQGIDTTFFAIHPYLCKVLPFSFSILTAFRNTGSYVSQEIWMVNNTSKTDVAPWCYKWVMGWLDWIGYLRVG